MFLPEYKSVGLFDPSVLGPGPPFTGGIFIRRECFNYRHFLMKSLLILWLMDPVELNLSVAPKKRCGVWCRRFAVFSWCVVLTHQVLHIISAR